jgi:aminoglycoside 2'-N-acetyltransferase I
VRVDNRRGPREDARVTDLRTAHTAELDEASLASARAMLDDVFEGELEDSDWEHALGGIHALLVEDGAVVGHGAVVQRRLLHRGRALRAGYVEAVGVRADRRRRGYGDRLMGALEGVVRRAYDVGALGSTDAGAALYTARGWRRWGGPTSALTPAGVRRTPDDDGAIYVLEAGVPLDLAGELTCDWRDGDVW